MGKLTEAQVVYERHPYCDERSGPGEYGRIGFTIGDRVFWVDSFYFPGTPKATYDAAARFSEEVVTAFNRGRALQQAEGCAQ